MLPSSRSACPSIGVVVRINIIVASDFDLQRTIKTTAMEVRQ